MIEDQQQPIASQLLIGAPLAPHNRSLIIRSQTTPMLASLSDAGLIHWRLSNSYKVADLEYVGSTSRRSVSDIPGYGQDERGFVPRIWLEVAVMK